MPDTTSKADSPQTGNAPGGRSSDSVGDAAGGLTKGTTSAPLGTKPEGFGLGGEDVKGSLKIHVKLDLEADIRIIARVKGDIAIGLL